MTRNCLFALLAVIALAPRTSDAATCDDGLDATVEVIGSYLPAAEAYARPYVFALRRDCDGGPPLVTVQRSTGNLPVCQPGQQVAVSGRLVWNKMLFGGHYEITDPKDVACR